MDLDPENNRALVPLPLDDEEHSDDEFHDAVEGDLANNINDQVIVNDDSSDSEDSNVPAEAPRPPGGPLHRGYVEAARSLFRRHRSRQGGSSSRPVAYDQQLPARHSYLGADLEELSDGHAFYEGGTILDNITLFPVPHLILVPGQQMPLQSMHPRAIAMFHRVITQHKVFGVISFSASAVDERDYAQVGTIAQVVAFKEEEDSQLTTLKLRAVGRQRFELLETQRQLDGWAYILHCQHIVPCLRFLCGKVRILPDVVLAGALDCAQLPCTAKLRSLRWYNERKNPDLSKAYISKFRKAKYYATMCTAIPSLLFAQYDLEEIISRIKQELTEWYPLDRIDTLAQNPVDFSYWVIASMPCDDETKLRMLRINCCVQRLRYALCLLKMCESLCCSHCGQEIGLKAEVFSMSVEGPMGAYVNPHGYIHETMTLHNVTGIRLDGGRQTTENSWFPGYAWTIANCVNCGAHMGWRFRAVAPPTLSPQQFWGITRAAIRPAILNRRRGIGTRTDGEEDEYRPCM